MIIPTFNSEATLRSCLRSVESQTYKNVEVIVVDRFSTDKTVEIAKDYGAVVLSKGPERSSQKNHGAKCSNGELLYFIDSDFVLEDNVISHCVKECNSVNALIPSNYSTGRSIWARSISLKRNLRADLVEGLARFMKRDIFFEVGGFDEDLIIGEDFDFNNRMVNLGYAVKRCDVVEWHIGEPERLKDMAIKSYYNGAAFRPYYKKRKKLAVHQLNPLQPKVLKKLLQKPTMLLFSLVLVDILRYTAAILGFLVSYLGEVKANSGTT